MSKEKHERMKHVEGLRGLAIILVLLFHLNGEAWANGYVGVDVFLVISGYMIFRTQAGQASPQGVRGVLSYLGRRIRRIVPPMAILILLTIGIGAFLLQPEDEIFAARVGYNALIAKANIFLEHEMSNYFGSDTAFNPLLHLWYLSIILQIYCIRAVVHPVVQRMPRRCGICVAWVVGAASLVWWSFPESSYYATLPRVWEVLAGGLVCILPDLRRTAATVAAAVGLSAILLPGVGAAPVCMPVVVSGAVLVLRYLPQSRMPGLLSGRCIQWVGRISFSLYLVHMPLIVFAKLWCFGEPGVWVQLLIIPAAAALGWGFWWAVEKRRIAWWLVLLLWVGAVLFCRAARKSEGFAHLVPLPSITWAPFERWSVCRDAELCANWDPLINPYWEVFHFMRQKVTDPGSPLLTMGAPDGRADCILMGDSHAMCLYAGLSEALRHEGLTGVYLGSVVVPFSDFDYRKNEGYYFNPTKEKALLAWLANQPRLRRVIISMRWHLWLDGVPDHEARLRRFLLALKSAGKQVILVSPIPEYDKNSTLHYQRVAVLRGLSLQDISPTCSPALYESRNQRELQLLRRMQQEGLCTLLNLTDALRPNEDFHASQDTTSFMVDTNHLSPAGAIWFMERLRPQLRRLLTAAQE